MTQRRIVIPLEVTEISAEIVPVVRHLFPPDQAQFTLVAVAQRNLSPMVTEAHLAGMPPSLYASPIYTEEEWAVHLRSLQEKLHAVAEQLRERGYTVETVLLKGEKVEAIAEFVESRSFDLLAMATYGRKGLSRLVYGSIAERLLRMIATPILLFRHQPEAVTAAAPAPAKPTTTIAAATDGTLHSREAVLLACRLARGLEARCRILVTADEHFGAAAGQQMMRSIEALVDKVEPHPELIPLVGPIDEKVDHYLNLHPVDLMVVGAFHDRGSGGAADIGRIAQRIVESTAKSVLVVKHELVATPHMLIGVLDDKAPVLEDALTFGEALNAQIDVAYLLPLEEGEAAQWFNTTDPMLGDTLAHDRRLSNAWQRIQTRLADRGISPNTVYIGHGEAASALLQLTQGAQYDLVAVAAPADLRRFNDSAADQLVRLSAHSVLVIRP